MRVSDAERSQVAESLSKHYADGRLDEAEFNERLQRAMSAKTRSDLAGLLVDVPPIVAPPPPEVLAHHRRGRLGLLVLGTFLLALAVSSSMWTWHFPWLLFTIGLFLIWRFSHRGWHYHRRSYGPGGPSAGPGGGMYG